MMMGDYVSVSFWRYFVWCPLGVPSWRLSFWLGERPTWVGESSGGFNAHNQFLGGVVA